MMVESPFFKDELIRMIADLGNHKVTGKPDMPSIIKVINHRIFVRRVEGFKHVFISMRIPVEEGTQVPDADFGVWSSYGNKKNHEIVKTASIYDWLGFIKDNPENEVALFMDSYLRQELGELKLNKIHRGK